jgi:S-methylmethionine-dependent homocysteine/selenocysteine methylase
MNAPAERPVLTLLDGPMGTELLARGVPTPLPGWSAHALEDAPEVVRAIHRDYAEAGARVHTTNTFRTRRQLFPDRWRELARAAVELARSAIPPTHRVAGSIAPLEDCYRPDLSPVRRDRTGTRAEHLALARVLADAGCDLLLCETFPDVEEGLLALDAALETGKPCWISFTPGYRADLLQPAEIAAAARCAARAGAQAVLVNCLPASNSLTYLTPLGAALAGTGVPFGCYANAGTADAKMGWISRPRASSLYAQLASRWSSMGASIIGGCCGTGPQHIRALALQLSSPPTP